MKKIIILLSLVFLTSSSVVVGSDATQGSSKGGEYPEISIQFKNMENLKLSESDLFVEDKSLQEGDEIKEVLVASDGLVVGAIVAVLVLLAISLFCIVFWIIMIIHAISKPIKSKAVWILILLLFGILGAIVYYFAIKKGFKADKNAVDAEKVE